MGDRIDQVTYEEYPEEMYPTNCHGTFYLFSAPVRNMLLQVFFNRTRVRSLAMLVANSLTD